MPGSRGKKSLGTLQAELRPSPLAAVGHGVLAVGSLLGAALVVALHMARVADAVGQGRGSEGAFVLTVLLVGLFLLGAVGFLLFALLHWTTRLRVFSRGLVWRRGGRRRVITWPEVAHFGAGAATPASLTSRTMLLHSGERIDFHSGLYNGASFTETMDLIAELIDDHQRLSAR